ncbi:uncharacterized protein SCHCODRAFT_02332308, partial [Schizophyllum commune H4-8]|uniref:uncharacterized protein n=1 Tax=Schizophyllum commune (strain H4-8 / FGSC 9210) TaxID=578458 RepID=UPI00215F1E5D
RAYENSKPAIPVVLRQRDSVGPPSCSAQHGRINCSLNPNSSSDGPSALPASALLDHRFSDRPTSPSLLRALSQAEGQAPLSDHSKAGDAIQRWCWTSESLVASKSSPMLSITTCSLDDLSISSLRNPTFTQSPSSASCGASSPMLPLP